MSNRTYDTFEEATTPQDDWVEFPSGGCGCIFGRCSRDESAVGGRDWYEPHEWALEEDDLPWFYFIASLNNLALESHDEFLAESKILWGDESDA